VGGNLVKLEEVGDGGIQIGDGDGGDSEYELVPGLQGGYPAYSVQTESGSTNLLDGGGNGKFQLTIPEGVEFIIWGKVTRGTLLGASVNLNIDIDINGVEGLFVKAELEWPRNNIEYYYSANHLVGTTKEMRPIGLNETLGNYSMVCTDGGAVLNIKVGKGSIGTHPGVEFKIVYL
jgi:hypothetical protein